MKTKKLSPDGGPLVGAKSSDGVNTDSNIESNNNEEIKICLSCKRDLAVADVERWMRIRNGGKPLFICIDCIDDMHFRLHASPHVLAVRKDLHEYFAIIDELEDASPKNDESV